MIEVETHLNITIVLALRGAVYVHNLHGLASSVSTLTLQHVMNGQSSLPECRTVRLQTVWDRRAGRLVVRLNDT